MHHWAKPWRKAEFGIFPWRWVGVNKRKESCILTKGVEPLFSALLGTVQRHGFGMSCCQKSAPISSPEGLPNNSTVQRCVKKEAKNRLGPAWESMAGDVHSGGQDWHPSAGMRYRLAKS
jgi:hypothetical protein